MVRHRRNQSRNEGGNRNWSAFLGLVEFFYKNLGSDLGFYDFYAFCKWVSGFMCSDVQIWFVSVMFVFRFESIHVRRKGRG